MTILYVKSTYERPSVEMEAAAGTGELTIVEQTDLSASHLAAHSGLITGNQLDQDAMLGLKPALTAFLDRGGRWLFNGHLLRPLVDGIGQYRPIAAPRRPDFNLSSVNAHPIFDGIDLKQLETNKGVAGFYGRGCNPLPEGAVAVNGLGPGSVPVDWVWSRPGGGRIFSHAGNDLSALGTAWGLSPLLNARIIDWVGGGACLDPWPTAPRRPDDALPLAEPEPFAGHRATIERRRRIVAPSSGTYYHIRSLEGPDYRDLFDVICTPEELATVLTPDDLLWVPCRTPPPRMIAQRAAIDRHLDAGGTVVALGESRSDLWLPSIEFTSTPTNWWWWLDREADLGVSVAAPAHPLMAGMGKADVTWHLHGWFVPPAGATVLATDSEGRAIFYEDKVSTRGTMIVSSLDPVFHHGSHFMPATTRFLDRFTPNLRAYADDTIPA